jgi:hypothetical protein
MATKTPVMIAFDSPTAAGAHGPLRAHPRKNLLSQMGRRAKGNAGRTLRYTKAGKVRKGRA